ncbi:MAG: RluA family pseudouridine synthase [Oscillospiraceae bacterium]|nr:RluA family pseudouridine synthase [Oscillospiraceae bacterium]
MEHITVIADEEEERADLLLARKLSGFSRSACIRFFETGSVEAAGKSIKKNYRVTVGESLIVALPDLSEPETKAQEIDIDVVYEDSDVIVVNKQRGMVVHPAPGHPDGTLVNALMARCGDDLSGIGGQKRPGIVHRIDKDTSGLIIAAKNDFTHLSLAAQLADRSLSRIYEAIVTGRVKNDKGTTDAPVGRNPSDRKRMAVTDKNSRSAVTHYEVITRYAGFTHIRCVLETGRTHQIRVHMAHIGHPVLGDTLYGGKNVDKKGLEGQCLHARALKFYHPRKKENMEFMTMLPDYFQEALEKLGPEEHI